MRSATPPGPYPSYMISSYDTPGSCPVPRRMARSMFSRGMLLALASATMVRRRGFMSGSPPPARAATVNSLMRRVKILPRLASAAPFLCLIECHLEWPDMLKTPRKNGETSAKILHLFREDDPHISVSVPGPAAVIAQRRLDFEARPPQEAGHRG